MKVYFNLLIILISTIGYSQNQQVVRGILIDNFTERIIENVMVNLILDDSTIATTTSGKNGAFSFKNVELGYYDVLFKHTEYNTFIHPAIEVSASKNTVLTENMIPKKNQLQAVQVSTKIDRGTPNNDMAFSSTFSIHPNDASKIAGGLSDPIRVAGTLPGVTSALGFSSNFISIRGNSPRGLKYQMDGIELPNPTHFARIGSSGGTFTIFSLQLLDKSDFFVSAFPAEFGDAIGGVFDVKFRNGNPKNHEFNIQAGTLGLEFGAEGPLNKGKTASYLFNYRYASTGLGRVGNPSIPTYQDFSFNLNFPLPKIKSILQIFSINGLSDRTRNGFTDSTLWVESLDRTNLILESNSSTLGLIFKKFIGAKSVLKLTMAGGYTLQKDNKIYILNSNETVAQFINQYQSNPISGALSFKHKFSPRLKNVNGVSYNITQHNWFASKYNFMTASNQILTSGKGQSQTIKGFNQTKLSLNSFWDIVAGVHILNYSVNNATSIEPRLSTNFTLSANHQISLAYGYHSQIENYATYLYQDSVNNVANQLPNKSLTLAKANHYILGYR
jgi:hypothetical protein